MQKTDYIDIFAALGEGLKDFGKDSASVEAVSLAESQNPWFTPNDIFMAVKAIRDHMLRRDILSEWLQRYDISCHNAQDVAVIMAGNIPLVGFSDMMCVLVCGHNCYIKPSSKDSALINYITDKLTLIEPGLPIFKYGENGKYDAAIATGSDSTGTLFRERFAGIPQIIRGSRSSVAILNGSETDEQLKGLSSDIFTYSGLGCRNVSLLLVPETYDMENLAARLNPPNINPKYRSNYLHTRAAMAVTCTRFIDGGSFLFTEDNRFPETLSRINYFRYGNKEGAANWLLMNAGKIQCVVGGETPATVSFGEAQYPAPWDYADGIDVINFLTNLE